MHAFLDAVTAGLNESTDGNPTQSAVVLAVVLAVVPVLAVVLAVILAVILAVVPTVVPTVGREVVGKTIK